MDFGVYFEHVAICRQSFTVPQLELIQGFITNFPDDWAHLGPSFSLPLTHVVPENSRALEFCICTNACHRQILLYFAIYCPVYTYIKLMLF